VLIDHPRDSLFKDSAAHKAKVGRIDGTRKAAVGKKRRAAFPVVNRGRLLQ
jgi:hypothetical protein